MKFFPVLMLLAVSLHCGQTVSGLYKPKPTSDAKKSIAKHVILGNIQDRRSGNNESYTALALIPLIPFGTATSQKPDELTRDVATPIKFYILSAIRAEFENVYEFASLKISESEPVKFDFRLSGTLNKYECRKRLYLYGLTFLGAYLWLLGPPAYTLTCEIDVTFQLTDATKRILHEKTYTHSDTEFIGIYYNDMSPDHMQNPKIIQKVLLDMLSDVKGKIDGK